MTIENPTYDFSAPYMRASIVTRDGNIFPLWLSDSPDAQYIQHGLAKNADQFGGYPLKSLPYVTGISVDLALGGYFTMKCSLSFPYEQGQQFLASDLIEFGIAQLQVQLGWVGGQYSDQVLSPVYEGMIIAPDVQFGEWTTVTLNAVSTSGYTAGLTTKHIIVPAGHMSRYSFIAFLAGHYKYKVKLSDDLEKLRATDGHILFSKPQLSQRGYTDWFFIHKLVWDSGCVYSLVNNILYIQSMKSWLGAKPIKELVYYHHNGEVTSSKLPIFSLSMPSKAPFLPGYSAVYNKGIASKTKDIVSTILTDAQAKIQRTGTGPVGSTDSLAPGKPKTDGVSSNGEGTENVTIITGSADDPDLNSTLAAVFTDGQMAMGLELTIGTIGAPDIVPGTTVKIRGAGLRYENDNFGVFSVSHTVDSNGFFTTLKGVSNTGAMLSKLSGDLATGDQNVEEADIAQGAQPIPRPPKEPDSPNETYLKLIGLL